MKATQKQTEKLLRPRARASMARANKARQRSGRGGIKRHFNQVLVPHKSNDYLPHLIRIHGLVAVLIIALLSQVVYSFLTTGNVGILGRVSNIQASDLLADTNAERERSQLSELSINTKLNAAASLKAQDMFKEQYWAHVSPDGVEPWWWLENVGYSYSSAGENLAKNYGTAQAIVDAWMGSSKHRENILKAEYTDVGFAVADGQLNGQSTTIVVAFYGNPASTLDKTGANHLNFSAATGSGTGPVMYFASALQSLSPVTVATLGLLTVVALVGAITHQYRSKLPQAWKKSWRVHHGLYTFIGMILLGVLVILATGGGSV